MDVTLLTGIDVIRLPAARWDSDYFGALKAADGPNRGWEVLAACLWRGLCDGQAQSAIRDCVISSYKRKRGWSDTLLRR